MKVLRRWNPKAVLRKWQAQAERRFHALDQKDFLLVATPASGKTTAALKIAHNLITGGEIERVVIVVPTEHLKTQWTEAAAHTGIDIDPGWSNADGRESADYFGVTVTYSQVSFAPDIYDFNCLRKKTLVIFDEIHHAGDGLDWGRKLMQAFGGAQYRLALSGTPFRSDDQQIPFVRYENRRSHADFIYGYGSALADRVCRPVYFPTVEGNISWIRGSGEVIDCTMLDELPKRVAAERLRAALDADGEWLREVLKEADAALTEMRFQGHADAAGLVIAIDQYHARRIAALLKVITNEEPELAISDEDDSSRRIARFARTANRRRWIVAVKMISEGVDIPRLRVGVYATTVTSELFFRQAVGRFLRMIGGLDEQSAAFYLPADAKLIRHALSIKDERDHYLPEKITVKDERSMTSLSNTNQDFDDFPVSDINGNSDGDAEISPGEFERSEGLESADSDNDDSIAHHSGSAPKNFIVPLSSEARNYDTIFDGQRFSDGELFAAEQIGRQIGANIPAAQVAIIMRMAANRQADNDGGLHKETNAFGSDENDLGSSELGSGDSGNPEAVRGRNSGSRFSTKAERKKDLRKKIQKQVGRLANISGDDCDDIHRRWIKQMNGQTHAKATEDELERKLKWINERISSVCLNSSHQSHRSSKGDGR